MAETRKYGVEEQIEESSVSSVRHRWTHVYMSQKRKSLKSEKKVRQVDMEPASLPLC